MMKTPELYAYKIDPDAWAKKMIALGTRDKQWDLVLEKIGPEIYIFPLTCNAYSGVDKPIPRRWLVLSQIK